MQTKIIRSSKRKKTIQGRLVDGILEIRAPSDMKEEELQHHVESLRQKILRKQEGRSLNDQELEQRAHVLNRQYFNNELSWQSIRWVTNQNSRYGSCTPSRGTIRISHRIASMPKFVVDYVVMHELAHLKEANHGKGFWALVNRYPWTERARGYLMAVGLEELET